VFEDDTKFLFPKDKDLPERLPIMAPIFVSMLVARAFITEGEVIDCTEVIEASQKYRRQQDVFSLFIHDNIETVPGFTGVGSREMHESFRLWYMEVFSGRKMPKLTELDDVITKKFGTRHQNGKWRNLKIKYDTPDTTLTNRMEE
jgi:hypothetical protein